MRKNLKRPRVSVVIPCFNRESIIGETLENMLSQSLEPSEVIVVDDGSTDNSTEVVKSFGDRVRLIRQQNGGPGSARNTGFRHASGEYLQFMDSDDLAALNKLEVQAEFLQQSGVDFAYSPWVKVTPNGNRIDLFGNVLQAGPFPAGEDMAMAFLTEWSIVLQPCLFRKAFLDRQRLFRTDIFIAEDLDFFLRIFLLQASGVHTPGTLTLYRIGNQDTLTSSGHLSERSACDQVKFLLDAIALCRQSPKGFDPLANTVFRQRLWSAGKSLHAFDSPQSLRLQKNVNDILQHNALTDIWYKCCKRGEQYRRGLRRRLKGYRDSGFFSPGPVLDNDLDLMRQIGFSEISLHKT